MNNIIEKHDLIQQNQKLVQDLESKNKELAEKNEVLTITAEVFNGTVTLNSKENKGTEFIVTLPFLSTPETLS